MIRSSSRASGKFQPLGRQVSLAVVCVFFVLGCAGSDIRLPDTAALPAGPADGQTMLKYQVGLSVQGRSMECVVLGEGEDTTLIIAGIHGNEPAGVTLVERLANYVQLHRELLVNRRVVILPRANPDGLAAGRRHNARGVDLNRNFDTANRRNNRVYGFSALCEPEARIITQLIRQYTPNRIISLHQPLACIDYDGPAEGLARRMAAYCDLPVRKLGARAGSLGSYAGETLHIPTITVEQRAGDEGLDRCTLWRRYGAMLLAAIAYPNIPEESGFHSSATTEGRRQLWPGGPRLRQAIEIQAHLPSAEFLLIFRV